MAKRKKATDEPIYIKDLAQILNRKENTIRKWERTGILPKRLHPKRGIRDWRYWTHAQVYGKDGIIAWMKKRDMRPGNLLTDPSKEEEHIQKLRRPKYLNRHHINTVRIMVENGKSVDQIVKKLMKSKNPPRYSSAKNLERALRGYFKQNGWPFPSSRREKEPTLEDVKKLAA